jgi:hypothetical protein
MSNDKITGLTFDGPKAKGLTPTQRDEITFMAMTPKSIITAADAGSSNLQIATLLARRLPAEVPDRAATALVMTSSADLANDFGSSFARLVPEASIQVMTADARLVSGKTSINRAALAEAFQVRVMTYETFREHRRFLDGRRAPLLVLDDAAALLVDERAYDMVRRLAEKVPEMHAFTTTFMENADVATALALLCQLPGEPKDLRTFRNRYRWDRAVPDSASSRWRPYDDFADLMDPVVLGRPPALSRAEFALGEDDPGVWSLDASSEESTAA